MADKIPKETSDAPFATRIDLAKPGLSPEQQHFIRQVELAQWKKKTQKLRTRNAVTGFAIGALVLGIYGYTFYSVSQEKIMDEMDAEAKKCKSAATKNWCQLRCIQPDCVSVPYYCTYFERKGTCVVDSDATH